VDHITQSIVLMIDRDDRHERAAAARRLAHLAAIREARSAAAASRRAAGEGLRARLVARFAAPFRGSAGTTPVVSLDCCPA
jgi:hypothetical protein